jgi:hypothetical protein
MKNVIDIPTDKPMTNKSSIPPSEAELSEVADWHSDKGYTLSTHQQQAEFEKKRNYPLSKEDKCPWDDWKSNKDIVWDEKC